MSHHHLRKRDENPDLKLIYFEAIKYHDDLFAL